MFLEVKMQEVMSVLEKVKSLLVSRRFWLFVAQAAIAIVSLAAIVGPIFGAEIDTSELPDEEALADQLMAGVERIVALIGGVLVVLRALSGAQELTSSYTARPPGSFDRSGLIGD
jgi:hypothetical protein